MKVAVFCSSSNNLTKVYHDLARDLGVFLAENNHDLVYGGASKGLMEIMAQAFKSCENSSAQIIGVIPDFLIQQTLVSKYVDEKIFVNNLSQRKDIMNQMSDAFIVLPGGFGTMDELFTVLAHQQVTQKTKAVLFFDPTHFYDNLIAQIKVMVEERIMPDKKTYFTVIDKLEDIKAFIN